MLLPEANGSVRLRPLCAEPHREAHGAGGGTVLQITEVAAAGVFKSRLVYLPGEVQPVAGAAAALEGRGGCRDVNHRALSPVAPPAAVRGGQGQGRILHLVGRPADQPVRLIVLPVQRHGLHRAVCAGLQGHSGEAAAVVEVDDAILPHPLAGAVQHIRAVTIERGHKIIVFGEFRRCQRAEVGRERRRQIAQHPQRQLRRGSGHEDCVAPPGPGLDLQAEIVLQVPGLFLALRVGLVAAEEAVEVVERYVVAQAQGSPPASIRAIQ